MIFEMYVFLSPFPTVIGMCTNIDVTLQTHRFALMPHRHRHTEDEKIPPNIAPSSTCLHCQHSQLRMLQAKFARKRMARQCDALATWTPCPWRMVQPRDGLGKLATNPQSACISSRLVDPTPPATFGRRNFDWKTNNIMHACGAIIGALPFMADGAQVLKIKSRVHAADLSSVLVDIIRRLAPERESERASARAHS